jgi:hypothetical protein
VLGARHHTGHDSAGKPIAGRDRFIPDRRCAALPPHGADSSPSTAFWYLR